MQKKLIVALVSAFVALAGCQSAGKSGEQAAPAGGDQAASGQAPMGQGGAAQGAIAQGNVVETMNSGGYTYVLIDTGKDKVWAAANEFPVKVGDHVVVNEGMPMQNFHSNTLDRDFDVIYFSNSIAVGGQGGGMQGGGTMGGGTMGGGGQTMAGGHPPMSDAANLDLSGIAKVDGGYNVADLFAQKDALSGKDVVFRGKVVKVNNGIMGKNWIHVRDGSGADGTNDITVTTPATVAVGDLVLVKGKVALNQDFGAGYAYDVIVEDADVAKE